MNYKGWAIYEELNAPVTGRWKAKRHGVRIGNNTKEGLMSMIDLRNADEKQAREKSK